MMTGVFFTTAEPIESQPGLEFFNALIIRPTSSLSTGSRKTVLMLLIDST